MLLRRPTRTGAVENGALLLVFRKGASLDGHSGIAVAAIVLKALEQANQQNVIPKLCVVVDVFSAQIFRAPARNRRLTSEIESACREIAVRWSSIAA